MLYDLIINSVPSNLNKLEIARFLYIRLGSLVSFSTVINNTDTNNFYRLLNLEVDPYTFNEIEVNCYTWAQLYSALLSHFKINNKIVKYWHSYVNFFIDGKKYVADATFGRYSDLSRIHYHDKTSFFGPCFYQEKYIDSNVVDCDRYFSFILDKIDKKINYSTIKTDEFKKLLNYIRNHKINIDSSNNIISKLEFIFSFVGQLSFGYYESKEFIYELEKNIFTKEELSKIGSIEFKKINGFNKIDIIQCIYTGFNGCYNYYILCPTFPIKSVTNDEILSLLSNGFISNKKMPGINIPGKMK